MYQYMLHDKRLANSRHMLQNEKDIVWALLELGLYVVTWWINTTVFCWLFCVAEQSTWTPFDPPRRDADADVETDQATSTPSAKLAGFGSVWLKLFYGGRKHPRSAAGQKHKLDIFI